MAGWGLFACWQSSTIKVVRWAGGNGQGLGYCTACFSGDYPCEIPEDLTKGKLEVGLFNCDLEKEVAIETE